MHIGSILIVLVLSVLLVAYITHPLRLNETEQDPAREADENEFK
jgi:cell division protein FtsL